MSPGLVKCWGLREGRAGLFGYPDQATFAFATLFEVYVGSILLGGATDRFGRKPVFGGSDALVCGGDARSWGPGTAFGRRCLRVAVLVAGLGLGAMQMVTIDCYLTELVPPGHLRGRAFSVAQFLQLLGIPAAHLIGFMRSRSAIRAGASRGGAGWPSSR